MAEMRPSFCEGDEGAEECRICKCGEKEGPLFRACQCRGSVQYVHTECLQKWLEVRPGGLPRCRDGEEINTKLSCEVCHSPYTIKIVQKTEWKAERLLSYRSCESYFECFSLILTLIMMLVMPVMIWASSNGTERKTLRDNWPLVILSALSMLVMASLALRKIFLRWRRAQSAPTISPHNIL
mmetsp:Transcript_33962/g.66314  ORF Transcript_33962/g.66314 Transcript_33962/m.66314 type:complete len:182 (-) Transcript_33962:467-1012(-)